MGGEVGAPAGGHGGLPEICSFNLSDLDVSALDVRLELSTLIPQCTLIICPGNCADCGIHCNVDCYINSGCNCHSYT
jgi:hypothetical protein